jgi:hypothetical protein
MKGIATALAKAQANMGKALKQANNPHFRSKYADLGNVMDACLPALNEAGIALIQPTGTDEHGSFVETILIHGESGEQLACRVPLILGKNDMQGFGSAVTYARRYGLMAMAGIAPEDDDGNAASAAAPKREAEKPQGPSPEAVEKAISYLGDAESLDDLKARWKNVPSAVAAHELVIAAKDAAKASLSKPILDDEIPY